MMTEYELLDYIEETANIIIAEGPGMNMSYCESMDMDMFPVVVDTILGSEVDYYLDCLHFLAQNGRFLPEEYADKSFDDCRAYLLEHRDEILEEIEEDCRYYQDEYE